MPGPVVLRVGDRVRFDGLTQTVVGLSGTLVRLADEQGCGSVVHLPYLLAADGFERLGERAAVPVLPAGSLHGVPQEVIEEAQWWERHIVEVITGRPPDSEAGVQPRLGYDPMMRSLVQREQAKAAELAAQGRGVSIRTLQRRRQRYEAQGLAGLVDWRADRHRSLHGRVDARVAEALRQAVEEATDRSTRTVAYLRWRTGQILAEQHGAGVVPMPSRATFYRLFERVQGGRHTTGSARTRQSLGNRPASPFSGVAALRPGELMQIDSTPLDVLVLLPGGMPGRVELTGMADLATRSITAAVLRPTTKSVDASLLLARTVTPEPMRPGWADALAMSRSVLPHRRLLDLDQRLEHAAARPVIVPETIVCDRGNVFISHNFRAACASLGINFQPAHPHTPADKPHIERTLESVSTLFCQFISGYLGRSAEHRGSRVEDEPLWSLLELQELLDEWIVAVWQHRLHDGLRDPVTPGRAYTPNERYAALVESAGYVPVALSAQDYIELLPARWQAINSYGIKVNHRVYDSAGLNPWRRQPSGVTAKKDLWEVHHDPYDVSQIWVRNHHEGGWITATWKHLSSVPAPFGELAWDHARQYLAAQGRQAAEAEIAQAVAALLDRAGRGPVPEAEAAGGSPAKPSRREQRVAARTKATAAPAWPRPAPAAAPAAHDDTQDAEDPGTGPLGEVVPLPVFDAREEASRWW
jgi:putative transposase